MDYRYSGQPLTPTMVEKLATELFAGELVLRSTIIERVREVHIGRGGSDAVAEITNTVKKGLQNLASRGMAVNPSRGYWRISGSPAAEPAAISDDSVDKITVIQGSEELSSVPRIAGLADRELGEGRSFVYVYYLTTYRTAAEARGDTLWQCKIGRTDRDPLARVLAQASTALPEPPTIALAIRTDDSLSLEKALHGVLAVRGRMVANSPGAEWFLTSPAEVESIYHFILPRISEADRTIDDE